MHTLLHLCSFGTSNYHLKDATNEVLTPKAPRQHPHFGLYKTNLLFNREKNQGTRTTVLSKQCIFMKSDFLVSVLLLSFIYRT